MNMCTRPMITAMPTAIRMTTNADILTLSQWLSPSFPVGGFAYSHGLETAIAAGVIATADGLEGWLRDVIAHGSGHNDAVLLRAGYAAPDAAALAYVNATALANCASAERQLEARLQGAAFVQTVGAIWGGEAGDLVFPVAVGAAAARAGIDVTLTATMYLHAVASTLVSAAVRAVPLGQTEGQRVLAALAPLCEQISQDSATTTLDDLHSTAFLSDIMAMRHETLQPRIFRS